MAIVLDILIIAIVALSVFLAYKKGMIKTLFSLVGGILAVVLAVWLSTPVANWLDREYIGPAVHSAVLSAVNGSSISESYDDALETVDVVETLKEMPDSLRSFLESINVDVDAIIAEAENAVSDSAAAKDQLIASIAEPISSTVSKAAALIGLALIFFILLFVVMHLLNAVFQMLPFGKSFNRVGGIIFGVVRAILIVMVLGAVIYGLACGNILLSVEELDQTILLKNINKINPILLAFQ